MEEGRRNERVIMQKAWQESANTSHPAWSLKPNWIFARAKGMTRSLPAGGSEKEDGSPATERGLMSKSRPGARRNHISLGLCRTVQQARRGQRQRKTPRHWIRRTNTRVTQRLCQGTGVSASWDPAAGGSGSVHIRLPFANADGDV